MNSNSTKQHLFTTTSYELDMSSLNKLQPSNKFSIGFESQEISSLNPFSNSIQKLSKYKEQELTPKTLISQQETLTTLTSIPTFEKFNKDKPQGKRYLFNISQPSQQALQYQKIFQTALKDEKGQDVQVKKNHTIGISILDNDGNFIWADQKTQCLLGTKIDEKSMTKNLFKLMISFSKFHLLKKYMGQRIMHGRKKSIRFKLQEQIYKETKKVGYKKYKT